MLTLLRAEDFRKTLERSPVDLADLIQRVADQVRPFTHARRLQLQTRLADDLGAFEIDADKISAVLVNLLTNAIKFTPDGGTIELVGAPERRPTWPRFMVNDRGVGLEPQAARAPVPAVLHPARSQPPFLGRFRLLQARAGARLEYCKTVRGDAWWTDRGREPRRGRHAGDRRLAATRRSRRGPCCRDAADGPLGSRTNDIGAAAAPRIDLRAARPSSSSPAYRRRGEFDSSGW